MEFAFGFLRWSETEFWSCSLRSWNRALAGYSRSRGIGADSGMSRKRLDELKALYPDN